VLTLLASAMALGQLDPEAIQRARIELRAAEVRQENFEKLAEGVKSTGDQVEATRRQIAEAIRIQTELEEARVELKRLEAEQIKLAGRGESEKGAVDLLARANDLRRTITELQADLTNLTQAIEKLTADLKRRQEPVQEPVVRIEGGGTGLGFVPTFIECTATSLVVYHNNRTTRIRRSDLSRSDTFAKILDAIAATEKGMAVFLIREDGLRTYYVARSIAKTRYCPNGKLPVLGQGKLDLSKFDQYIAQQNIPTDLPEEDNPTGPERPLPPEAEEGN
jgi:hypothetical protein